MFEQFCEGINESWTQDRFEQMWKWIPNCVLNRKECLNTMYKWVNESWTQGVFEKMCGSINAFGWT